MSFKQRCKKYLTSVEKAEKDTDVKRLPRMVFPRHHNRVPILARFAIWLLSKHEAEIVDTLVDVAKPSKNGKTTKSTKRKVNR